MMSALPEKGPEFTARGIANPAPSVKALAERLRRDYKRVHEDVETLAASGLVRREEVCVRGAAQIPSARESAGAPMRPVA